MKTNIKSRCEFRVRKKAPKNGSKSGFGSVLGPIWARFGTVLGLFWELLGASGPFFWCLEATFDKALVHDGLQEAFELDFGASGPQFWRFQAPLVERKKRTLGSTNLNAPKCKLGAWVWKTLGLNSEGSRLGIQKMQIFHKPH